MYIQSAFAMPTTEKLEQEYRPLRKLRDSFRKFVITHDDIRTRQDDDGIVTMGLIDFLLDVDSLG